MEAFYIGYVTKEFDRDQLNFLPISFDELIDEDNPVRVIEAFVEMLDMEKLECKRNIELMWLLKGLTPDDKSISDFKKDNKKAVDSAFKQFSMPAVREMRKLYQEGMLGEFEYGEGEYLHNCESISCLLRLVVNHGMLGCLNQKD